MNWFRRQDGSDCDYVLTLHIQPGARRTEAAGLYGDALKIKLATAPVDGKANAALVEFLAESFGVPRQHIELKQGEKSRRKVVVIRQARQSPDSAFDT